MEWDGGWNGWMGLEGMDGRMEWDGMGDGELRWMDGCDGGWDGMGWGRVGRGEEGGDVMEWMDGHM
jgi:hypothetical protein